MRSFDRSILRLATVLVLLLTAKSVSAQIFLATPAPSGTACIPAPPVPDVPPQYVPYYIINTIGCSGGATALQLNVQVGTGIIHDKSLLSNEYLYFFIAWETKIFDTPFELTQTVSVDQPWVILDAPIGPVTTYIECSSGNASNCGPGEEIAVHFDASGLAVGSYLATVTLNTNFGSGDLHIALNIVPRNTVLIIPPSPPGVPAGPDHKATDGDPVDLSTGLSIYTKTDLVVNDVLPINVTRTFRGMDGTSRAFGLGSTHPYDMFLWNVSTDFSEMNLILPDGQRIPYVRVTPGTDYATAVLQSSQTPGDFFGSSIKWNGQGWSLTLRNGTVYGFGPTAPLQFVQDRHGNRASIARDASGNIVRVTSPNNRWVQFTTDASQRIMQVSDNGGRNVTYSYNTGGYLSTVTDPNGGVTTYTYDSNGNMSTIQDPRGIVYLTNQYDAQNRVVLQTQADGSTFQYAYTTDADNKIIQTNVTDPRGNVRQATFDANGYLLTDTRALGRPEQQTTTYNRQSGTNLLLSVADPLNRLTASTYDAMGNITSSTRLSGTSNAVTTTFAYEPQFNQLATLTDPLSHKTSLSYDGGGNPVTISDPLGNATTMSYNPAGQPLSVTDPLGNTTTFVYSAGDLIAVKDPLGRTTNRFVDTLGRLTSLTDPLGRITRLAYSPMDQITNITDVLGNKTGFAYDTNGNTVSVVDANENITQYTYDSMDRLAIRKDALLNQENYQYDGNGNLTRFTDRRGKVALFSVDGLNRVTFAGYGNTGGPPYESTVTYTYDAANRLAKAVDSGLGTITRSYDPLDHLTLEATPQGAVSYTYDAAGRRSSLAVPGQTVANYSFDPANRLSQITRGSAVVSFTYDNEGRRTSLTLPNGLTTIYTYDKASELTGLTYANGSTVLGNLSYGYDLAGRRTMIAGTYARTILPSPVSGAVYNANNQLVQWGATALNYDANGNMVGDGTNNYTWDAQNRMVSPFSGASFSYDPFGRRVSKTTGSMTTNYLYDGGSIVQELTGSTPVANLLTGVADEIFTRTDSTGTSQYLTDALGSTTGLTDSTGAFQTTYTYEPFGNTNSLGMPSTNPFQYTGRENDGTGLFYYRARYYNPTIQRFISEDPIGFRGGLNRYAYVDNSPLNWVDPTGTDKKKCPPVPFHPGGANIDQNISDEKSNSPLISNLFGMPLVLDDFYQNVRNHGPWDYKQNRTLNDFGLLDVASPFEDFGNFNFGATAAALGIPEAIALRGAGYAGQRAIGNSLPDSVKIALGQAPFGDDPADQIQIKLGYKYYRNGCHQ